MTLVKWAETPFESLERTFVDTFDNLESRFAKRFGLAFGPAKEAFIPNLDISEDSANFYIIAELPGVEEKDLKLTIDNDVLTVSGQKQRQEEKKDRNYHRIERSFGEFVRSLSLPVNVKANAIEATFNNGLLEITLPKLEVAGSTTREIPLNGTKRIAQNKQKVPA